MIFGIRRDVVAMDVSQDLNGEFWEAPILADEPTLTVFGIGLPRGWLIPWYIRVTTIRRQIRGVGR